MVQILKDQDLLLLDPLLPKMWIQFEGSLAKGPSCTVIYCKGNSDLDLEILHQHLMIYRKPLAGRPLMKIDSRVLSVHYF